MTGGRERGLGTVDRSLVAGGAAVAAHVVVIVVLSLLAPVERPRREIPRVDFEMASIPPPPEPAAVPEASAPSAQPAPSALPPRKEAKPAASRAAALEERERVNQIALLKVLGSRSEGGSLDVALGTKEGGLADLLADGEQVGGGSGGGELVGIGTSGGDLRVGIGTGTSSSGGSGTGSVGEVGRGDGREGVSSEAVRKAVQGKIHYPRAAEEMGIEGRVVVSFRIDSQGAVLAIRVVRSAGEVLDAAAVDAVNAAAPFDSPPGRVVVPVDFTLPDQ